SYISGTATILFTLGVITGLVIWFPQKLRTWRQGLRVKWKAGWKRVNHDLHNKLAFYSLIILFIMGSTGLQWSFPWYREGLQKTLGTYREAPAGGRGGNNAQRGGNDRPEEIRPMLPINQLLAATDEVLPYRGDYTVSLSGSGPVTIRKNKVG